MLKDKLLYISNILMRSKKDSKWDAYLLGPVKGNIGLQSVSSRGGRRCTRTDRFKCDNTGYGQRLEDIALQAGKSSKWKFNVRPTA